MAGRQNTLYAREPCFVTSREADGNMLSHMPQLLTLFTRYRKKKHMTENTIHPNRRTLGPYIWTRKNGQEEVVRELDRDSPIGSIQMHSDCPYVSILVDRSLVWKDPETVEVTYIVEPASIEQARQRKQEIFGERLYPNERERCVHEAKIVAEELAQQSWFAGVPADATIFCDAHQTLRPAHGANHYDHITLCNTCVKATEVLMAKGEIQDVTSWTREQAKTNLLLLQIDEAERTGNGSFQLGQNRWLEVFPLYLFVKYSEYKQDIHPQLHWPYQDMQPSMYLGYLRDDWSPGEYVNVPARTIYFTNRDKLRFFLMSGGHLEKVQEAEKTKDEGEK